MTNPEEIDRYSLRRSQQRYSENLFPERQRRVFAKSVKFKYPRQLKRSSLMVWVRVIKRVGEISPNLRYIIDEA
ncbi:hypothetical protein DMI65_16555 [Escherichia coli]|nr:hypothetical protein [Escherichia coli]